MKIVFFGTPDFVTPVLDKLSQNFDVVQTIHSPQQLNNLSAEALAKEDGAIEQLRTLNPDFFVVASFGKILTKELLEIPKLGAINIHPSLLPKYRGPTPIQTAILNGDEKTGVSFIKMDEKVDHGPILLRFEEKILATDTFESLAKRLFRLAADKLPEVINVDLTETSQDESKATYTKLLIRNDGYIDADKPPSAQQLNRMIRAYFPWPGVFTRYSLISPISPKSLIKLLPNNQLQIEGKKPMSCKDFANGYPRGKEFLEKLNLV